MLLARDGYRPEGEGAKSWVRAQESMECIVCDETHPDEGEGGDVEILNLRKDVGRDVFDDHVHEL